MFPQPPPDGIDDTTPSAARLYDYYLGGNSNYAVDRQAAEDLYARIPDFQTLALANREFLGRVVTHLARDLGVDQFLDLGSGLPTQDNTHEIVQRHQPSAHVVYVDYDPMVKVHAEALMAEDPATTTVIHADLRAPDTVLNHPEVTRLLDFTRPVAVLMVAILHFVPDRENPEGLVRAYRDRLCAGSYIAISHVDNSPAPDRARVVEEHYATTSTPAIARPTHDIAAFFAGMDVLQPGVVPVADWRHDLGGTRYTPAQAWVTGGLARTQGGPLTGPGA